MDLTFVTDTSTLCVFDLAALEHRLHADDDWWSIPTEEVAEMNMGNVAFLGLGQDGRFRIQLIERVQSGISLMLNCPSGRVFIGAGEEVTSGGLQPEALRGGGFHELEPGTYEVNALLAAPQLIQLSITKSDQPGLNRLTGPISLTSPPPPPP